MTNEALRGAYFRELRRRRLTGALTLALLTLAMVAGFWIADMRNSGTFFGGLRHLFDFPADILAEASRKAAKIPGECLHSLPALIETLNIAAVATLVGTLGGGLMSLLAAPGFAPFPRAVPVFRRMMDLGRALPEIVVALVLIYVLGGGPVPATIAISIHSIGALGKLFSEVNENADLKPVEGLTSVGAVWSQRMAVGVLPQVAPNWLSYMLLRFEINIRASAILGFVGAGGIGYELKNAISWGKGRYDEAAAVFILLILTIIVVDQTSSALRNRLTTGA
ncbi:MAG: phosphonate ABC transporter, permease protein PhnE [Paracoccaceae bacterium]|nr:phosphonate ABC transporter, permease protein PhnE [Paracoccaceae bacterium]